MSNSKYKDISKLSKQSIKRRFNESNQSVFLNNELTTQQGSTNLSNSLQIRTESNDFFCGDNNEDIEIEYEKCVLSDFSECSTESDTNRSTSNINEFLRCWATESNVPQIHMNTLIKYLKKMDFQRCRMTAEL